MQLALFKNYCMQFNYDAPSQEQNSWFEYSTISATILLNREFMLRIRFKYKDRMQAKQAILELVERLNAGNSLEFLDELLKRKKSVGIKEFCLHFKIKQ